MHAGRTAIVAFLAALLGAAVWYAFVGWTTGNDSPVSGHAYVAMALGIVLSIIVGCGLMALLFISSRRGYDEPPKLIVPPTNNREEFIQSNDIRRKHHQVRSEQEGLMSVESKEWRGPQTDPPQSKGTNEPWKRPVQSSQNPDALEPSK